MSALLTTHTYSRTLYDLSSVHVPLTWTTLWYAVVVVVVEIFIHGAVKATVTNAPQSQLNK